MRRLTDEHGSVAIIVALLGVVLFAMSAFVIDVGALVQERRVLQNGADASALAIAEECGGGDCGDPDATAEDYADKNSDDGFSAIEELCGRLVTGVEECSDPPDVPDGAGYVRVTTKTERPDGTDQVRFSFARFLGFEGKSVHTRATVAWGGPSSLTSEIPLTISQCEYEAYTANGFAEEPYDEADEAVIYLHTPGEASPCPSGPAGSDNPGGFGWLDDPDDDCMAESDTDGAIAADTGNAGSRACLPDVLDTVIHIPIFQSTNDLSGNNSVYYMKGFAAFYVTGYNSPGYKTQPIPCESSQTCLSGYFVQDDRPVSGTIGGPSMGVVVVQLIG